MRRLSTRVYGLLEAEDVIQKSGVREVFTPHSPIDDLKLFMGRQQHVKRTVEAMGTPGEHVIIFGERGVGKSSLANVTAKLVNAVFVKGELYEKRCDSDDTFHTIWSPLLAANGINGRTVEEITTQTQGGGLNVGVAVAGGGVNLQRQTTTRTGFGEHRDLQASEVAAALRDIRGVALVDEVDQLRRRDDRKRLGKLVKLLSDYNSPFKVMFVGIASCVEELIIGHESAQRCLREVRLDCMDDQEIRDIIVKGADAASITFSSEVTARIVDLSAGYPYFAQLLGLKCAEEAIRRRHRSDEERHYGAGRPIVDMGTFRLALEGAVGDADASLTRTYQGAVRSAHTDRYKDIVRAAAQLPSGEFNTGQLRAALAAGHGGHWRTRDLSSDLQRLVATDSSKILRRLKKGVYRFQYPRMRCYVRMVTAEKEEPK